MVKQAEKTERSGRSDDRVSGVALGQLLGFEDGQPKIMLSDDPASPPLTALSTVSLSSSDVGCAVALSFENGDPVRPIVLGKLIGKAASTPDTNHVAEVSVDGDPHTLEITGEREVVLRCGKASITLTKSGKIILRGTYISSRSSGMNRIKGGSVQLN